MKNRCSPLRTARRERRGGILVLALISVITVGALSFALLKISISTTERQGAAVDQRQAFYLAEAGLSEAFAGLGIGKTGQVGSQEEPVRYGQGLFWVDVTDLGNNQVQLESTAMVGHGRATLGLVVRARVESISSLGIFSTESLRANPGVLIDSFDSTLGPYALQVDTATNYQAILGSNGDIKLQNGTEIRGDAVVGPTGAVDAGGGTITGIPRQRPEPASIPAVDVPDVGILTSLSHSGAAPLVIPAGEHGHSVLELGMHTSTLVQGPATLVIGDLTLKKGATLELDATGGPIEIFITGSMELDLSAFVVTTLYDPAGVVFQIASDDSKALNLGAQSTFYGFIYAPHGDVKLGAKFNLYGGLVANSYDVATKGAMHFDTSVVRRLRALPGRVSWRVVDVPGNLAAKGGDPFHALGVDRNKLLAPAEAHADQPVAISYYDLAGALRSYAGMERAFDWSDVSQVVELSRDGKTVVAPAEWAGGKSVDPRGEEPLKDPPIDPADGVFLDAIVDPNMNSRQLMLLMLERSPGLSDFVLLAAINRDPPMNDTDLESVLNVNSQDLAQGIPSLSADVMHAMIGSDVMSPRNKQTVLLGNSPLEADVLRAALDMSPPMSSNQVSALLSKQ